MKIRVEANRVLRLENVVSGSVMEVPDKCAPCATWLIS